MSCPLTTLPTAAGIYNSGTLTLTSSTISGNSMADSDTGNGGGIDNTGKATLTNVVVSGNSTFYGNEDEPGANGGGIEKHGKSDPHQLRHRQQYHHRWRRD